jgi:hypothetical protein
MHSLLLIACLVLGGSSLELRASTSRKAAQDLAAKIVDACVKTITKYGQGPEWQELDRRLGRLFANNAKEADEAIVILHSFYLGEHNSEEMRDNLLERGTRMIPMIERYLQEKPSSLIEKYPKEVGLDRTITVAMLTGALEILRVRAGAKRVASASFETAPLRHETGNCAPKLLQHPDIKPGEELVQPGESYAGMPVLRATILESGEVIDGQLFSRSGVQRLDALLSNGDRLKYAPRPNCGAVQANIVILIDWMPPR